MKKGMLPCKKYQYILYFLNEEFSELISKKIIEMIFYKPKVSIKSLEEL